MLIVSDLGSLMGLGKKPEVVKGITTGLVFWDKRAIDWDYLEWFLGEHLSAQNS